MQRIEFKNYSLNVETERTLDPCKIYRGKFTIDPAARSALMKEVVRKRVRLNAVYRGKYISVSYNSVRDYYWYSFDNEAMKVCLLQQVSAELGMAQQVVNRHKINMRKNYGRK